jgi:hypothetical protein
LTAGETLKSAMFSSWVRCDNAPHASISASFFNV